MCCCAAAVDELDTGLMGSIRDKAERRWREDLPSRDNCDRLTWLALKNVLWPMLREMADKIEELQGEVEAMQAARKKRKR